MASIFTLLGQMTKTFVDGKVATLSSEISALQTLTLDLDERLSDMETHVTFIMTESGEILTTESGEFLTTEDHGQ